MQEEYRHETQRTKEIYLLGIWSRSSSSAWSPHSASYPMCRPLRGVIALTVGYVLLALGNILKGF